MAVTGTATPVSVNTGRALAHGTWYENTAAVTVAIATPGAATRIDYIVLRKDWVLQTVRITRIAGVEGGAAPALVQIAGTTWDTPLATVSITTGGVITVTDVRQIIGGYVEAALAANVTMTNANTYYDGPSISLTPGTWLIVGGVTVGSINALSTAYTAKLWDGTTVESSAQEYSTDANNSIVALPLSGVVVVAATATYKISCAASRAGDLILAAATTNGAGNNASHIHAVRLS